MQDHTEYKTQLLGLLDHMLAEPMSNSANFQTMLAMKERLKQKGLNGADAEEVATKMQIVVDEEVFADSEFIEKIVDGYAEIIYRMYQFAYENKISREGFMRMADGINLTIIPPR